MSQANQKVQVGKPQTDLEKMSWYSQICFAAVVIAKNKIAVLVFFSVKKI